MKALKKKQEKRVLHHRKTNFTTAVFLSFLIGSFCLIEPAYPGVSLFIDGEGASYINRSDGEGSGSGQHDDNEERDLKDSGSNFSSNSHIFTNQIQNRGRLPWKNFNEYRQGSYGLSFKCWPNLDTGIDRTEYWFEGSTIGEPNSSPTSTNRIPFGQERWTGISYRLPSSTNLFNTSDNWVIVSQWWQVSPGQPPLALYFKYNQLRGDYRNDDTGLSNGIRFVTITGVPRNKWLDVVIRYKFDAVNPNGFCKINYKTEDQSSYTLKANLTSVKIGYTENQGGGSVAQSVRHKFGIYRKSINSNTQLSMDEIRNAVGGGQMSSVQPDRITPDVFYRLRNTGSQNCAGINGSNIRVTGCSTSNGQKFEFEYMSNNNRYRIRRKNTSKCWGYDAATNNIRETTCNTYNSQRWTLQKSGTSSAYGGRYLLKNVANGKCARYSGSNVELANCNSGNNSQKWTFY